MEEPMAQFFVRIMFIVLLPTVQWWSTGLSVCSFAHTIYHHRHSHSFQVPAHMQAPAREFVRTQDDKYIDSTRLHILRLSDPWTLRYLSPSLQGVMLAVVVSSPSQSSSVFIKLKLYWDNHNYHISSKVAVSRLTPLSQRFHEGRHHVHLTAPATAVKARKGSSAIKISAHWFPVRADLLALFDARAKIWVTIA